MKKITILQSSLREGSHTAIVCREFEVRARAAELEVSYIDLNDVEMEFCDGRKLEDYNESLQEVHAALQASEIIIFGMPVYQYSMSGVLKNILDICGAALKEKHIGVILNSGGPNCYMAAQDLFNAMQYEYTTTSIMPTPYTSWMDFKDWKLVNEKAMSKLDELVEKISSL